jgi:hypothetical protein
MPSYHLPRKPKPEQPKPTNTICPCNRPVGESTYRTETANVCRLCHEMAMAREWRTQADDPTNRTE